MRVKSAQTILVEIESRIMLVNLCLVQGKNLFVAHQCWIRCTFTATTFLSIAVRSSAQMLQYFTCRVPGSTAVTRDELPRVTLVTILQNGSSNKGLSDLSETMVSSRFGTQNWEQWNKKKSQHIFQSEQAVTLIFKKYHPEEYL